MQFVASFENGTITHVVAVDEHGSTHLENRWIDANGTFHGDEIVFGEGAVTDLIHALKGAQSAI